MRRPREFWLLLGAGLVVLAVHWLPLQGAHEPGDVAVEVAAYPTRSITLISWVTPGSPTDLLARAIASVGPTYFGQRITVVTKQGGGGAVAMGYLLRQRPDGHTLAINTSSGTISMAAGHLPFEPDQFTYISRVQLDPYVVAVQADSPFETLADFFRYAHDNPGALAVAGFGTASGHFLSFARLSADAGRPDIRWLAYEGSADANLAVLGGHTDAVNANYSVIREHLRAGSMRVLGVSAPVSALPNVPTYEEQGYALSPVHWRGVMGPGRMPPALLAKVYDLLEQTFRDPEFARYMEASGTEMGRLGSTTQFQEFVRDELTEARTLMTELDLVR